VNKIKKDIMTKSNAAPNDRRSLFDAFLLEPPLDVVEYLGSFAPNGL